MANDTEPKYNNQLAKDLADNSTGPVTQRTILYGWDPSGLQKVKLKVAADGTLATSATLSGGGGDGSILDGVTPSIKATVLNLTNSKPLASAIVDGSGNQITSFGGGTQYADAAARGTATGTLLMVDDGTNIQSALGTTAGVLKIDLSATTANATAIKVDGSAAVQPISASALPLPALAATSTKQSDGTQKTQIVDGSGNVVGTTTNALDVNIKSAANITLTTSDIEIGGVEIKNGTDDTRAIVTVANALKVDNSAVTQPVSGTFWQSTQPTTVVDGGNVTMGTKADAKSTATDTTAVSMISVLKQISASVQAPPSQAVTNAGTFATQATLSAGSAVIGHVIADTGSTTAVTQPTGTNLHTVVDSGTITTVSTVTNLSQLGGVAIAMGTGVRGTGVQRVTIATDDVVPVTGTFWQTTQPVSLATNTPTLQSGSTTAVTQATAASLNATVVGTGTFVTQSTLAAETTKVIGTVNVAAAQTIGVTQATGTNLHAVLDANSGVDIGKLTANQSVNTAQINGVTPLMGTGIMGTGSARVTIASDNDPLTVKQATGTNLHTVVDSGTITTVSTVTAVTTVSTVTNLSQLGGVAISMGTGTRGTGVQRVTIATDDLVPVSAAVGSPVFATLTPSTTGGWTPKSLVALTSTKTAVKAGAGTMGGYMFYNPNATVSYIQVWNVAIGSITVGTTAPTYVIPLPATSGANIEWTNGINHSTEINVAATTTATGSTAPTTAIDGFMLYK